MSLFDDTPPLGPFRTITIPSYLHFDKLHNLLQVLFEWDDSHLHKFTKEVEREGPIDPFMALLGLTKMKQIICPRNVMIGLGGAIDDDQSILETRAKIGDYLININDKIEYEYDFGSSWKILIQLLKIENETIEENNFNCIDFINVINGRGKLISEYNNNNNNTNGKKYNRNQINQSIKSNENKLIQDYQGKWKKVQIESNESNESNVSNVNCKSNANKDENDNEESKVDNENDNGDNSNSNSNSNKNSNDSEQDKDTKPPPRKKRKQGRYEYKQAPKNNNSSNASPSACGLPPPLEKF